MRLYVGITDGDWYESLAARLFSAWSRLPASLAWETFGPANGAGTLAEMRRRIERYKKTPPRPHEDYPVGGILLEQPFFFPESEWIPPPADWHPNVQVGKGYALDTVSGRRLWTDVPERLARLAKPSLGNGRNADHLKPFAGQPKGQRTMEVPRRRNPTNSSWSERRFATLKLRLSPSGASTRRPFQSFAMSIARRGMDVTPFCLPAIVVPSFRIRSPIKDADAADGWLTFCMYYGTEFCGKPETHPYELLVAMEGIEYRATRGRSPRTNGFVERMNRTLLDECFRVVGRTTWYVEVEEIQRDLDRFLAYYNVERTHQGHRLKGRTRVQALCEALGLDAPPDLGGHLKTGN